MIDLTSEMLKDKLNEKLVIKILKKIGCHSIKKCVFKGKHVITCCNPDGNNRQAINVYLDNFFVQNNTRPKFESKKFRDIITLVEFIKDISYSEAMKTICDICDFNYYEKTEEETVLNKWLRYIETGVKKDYEDEYINPITDNVLNQFKLSPVKRWVIEGINFTIQEEFQIGIDIMTERIIIPIRDEIGSLVGVKGRLLHDDNINDDKYSYIYSCPKSKVLYGLYKNYKHIKQQNEIIIVEGEKGVLKLKSLGYHNAVAIGSKSISKVQIDKILRLNVPITIALDKDVKEDEINSIVNEFKYPVRLNDIYVINDTMNFLDKKESPMDNAKTWSILYNNFKFKAA
ncbi:MAG: hypothetical protein ACM3O3_12435 [Syntrophothermus sp.]